MDQYILFLETIVFYCYIFMKKKDIQISGIYILLQILHHEWGHFLNYLTVFQSTPSHVYLSGLM